MSDFRDELFDDDDDFGLDDDGGFDFDAGAGQSPVRMGQVIGDDDDFSGTGGDGRFLGMNAGERAFLSVMIFLNVAVLGIGLLMASGRMTLG